MKHQSGFVLLTVLVFIQIFSLISLFSINNISSNAKNNGLFWELYIYRLEANKILKNKESIVGNTQRCFILPLPATVIVKKSDLWWQMNTCGENTDKISYHYAFESLGNDGCGVMGKDIYNQYLIAHYYRITLRIWPDKLKGFKYLVQSTVAVPVVEKANCKQSLHEVKPGRQMWREI